MIYELSEVHINCAYGRILRPNILQVLVTLGSGEQHQTCERNQISIKEIIYGVMNNLPHFLTPSYY